jgi:hypothetical protein
MAKLSLSIIFFTVTYVQQQYIRQIILRFGGNNTSANVLQHYVPRTYYVPSYIYETNPEVLTLLIPVLLFFTVRIHIHLSPILRTNLPKISPKQYFDLKISVLPTVLPTFLYGSLIHSNRLVYSIKICLNLTILKYWVKTYFI